MEGRKEDCEYWMKLKTMGLKVKSEVCSILSQINEKCVGFADAQTTYERRQKQERQKNRKKDLKRKVHSMKKIRQIKTQKNRKVFFQKGKMETKEEIQKISFKQEMYETIAKS